MFWSTTSHLWLARICALVSAIMIGIGAWFPAVVLFVLGLLNALYYRYAMKRQQGQQGRVELGP